MSKRVIVIGSGIGGLSTAILLSMLGFEVTVVEKNSKPGGVMRSFTRNGFDCEVGVHYLGAMAEGQILRRLLDFMGLSSAIPLERMGKNGIIDRYVFDDLIFDLPEGLDAYKENLINAFPMEQKAITALMIRIQRSIDRLNSLDFLFSPKFDDSLFEDIKPVGEILRDLNCSKMLKHVLTVPSGWIGVPIEECPSFFHHMVLGSYLLSSWRLSCTGKEMAEAFSMRLRSLGGQILTGDGVQEILIDGDAVSGVRLSSGMELAANFVIGAVHPANILQMVPEGVFKKSFRKRILNFSNTHGMICVYAAVDESDQPALPYNLLKITQNEQKEIRDSFFCQIRNNRNSSQNLLTVLTESHITDWENWESSITGRRGDDYENQKLQIASQIIDSVKTLFDSLRTARIIDVWTPLTLRDWAGNPNGTTYGIKRSSSQIMASTVLNRSLLKGLFFSGQNLICPGILGTVIGSYSTVRNIIGSEAFRKSICI